MSDKLKVFTLGGLGEFGKNFMVLQQGQDAIIVDCGAQFSDGRNPGLDLIIPDFTPMMDESITIHAILLTHGHEDHIGSVPYFLNRRNVAVYGTPFTKGLVEKKCKELFHRLKLDFHLISEKQEFHVGPFHITPVAMAHSIPETLGFFIDTALGCHFHTADFKIDPDPADGRKTDMAFIEETAKKKKMLLLTSDSTNAVVPGSSRSEKSIRQGIEKACKETQGTLVVTSFASHIPRIFQLCQIADQHHRKVLLLGRSVLNNVALAKTLGHMNVPDKLFVNEQQASKLKSDQLMIISTGTQGESRAALSKLAFGHIKNINLGPGDRVVFSSRAIPGNERAIYTLINHIHRTGADVWTWEDEHVHVSGHAYREDLVQMIQAINPKYFLPVHGELRMLKRHQALAIESGVAKKNALFIENGDVLEFTSKGVTLTQRLELFPKIIDEGMLVELSAQYLKDRKKLAQQGSVIVVLTIDERFGLLHDPILEEYGFVDEEKKSFIFEQLNRSIEREMQKLSKKPSNVDLIQEVKTWVYRVCRKHLGKKPVPHIIIVQA